MKIIDKISLSFLLTTVMLTVLSSAIFYLVVSADILKTVDMRLDSLVYSRARHIETYLDMLEASATQLSKSVVLENFLKTDKKNPAAYKEAFATAEKRLIRTKQAIPSIAEFFLLDNKGQIAASSYEADIGTDMSTDALFAGGQKKVYFKDAYYSEKFKKDLMAVSAPMVDSETDEFLGVIAAKVDLEDLCKIATDTTSFSKTEEMFILNKYGYMITPSRFLKDTFLKKRIDTENTRSCIRYRDKGGICNLDKTIMICPDYRGIMIAGSNAYIPRMQWCLISKIDTGEALAPLRKTLKIALALVIVLPFLAWSCGIFFASRITKPLHKLRRGVEIVGSGNLDYRVGIASEDEVGELSRAFDTMTEHLKQTTTSVVTLNKEIAQRKEAEYGLRRLAAIVESSDDAIIGKNLNGMITSWNSGAERLYGYTEKEILGENISIMVPEDRREELRMMMQKVGAGQGIEHHETVRIRKDGTKVEVSLVISPIKDNDGNIVGASSIAHDITERKRFEKILRKYGEDLEKKVDERTHELREAQDKLVRTEKLAIVGKLASSVAHELRNPLGVIKNAVYYINMLEQAKNMPEMKENLDIITQEIWNSDKIITDLLEFSRAKEPVFRPEDINFIIKEVLDRIRIGPNIELVLESGSDLPDIEVDALQIHQVLYNLIKNALESMEKGGKLTIRTALKGAFAEVALSDTGSGIAKEDLPKIFEPLFSTKTKGIGLGLAVCAMLVEKHGGKIEVESEVGKGSVFTVKLPVKRVS